MSGERILEPYWWVDLLSADQQKLHGVEKMADGGWRYLRQANLPEAYPSRRAGIPKIMATGSCRCYRPERYGCRCPGSRAKLMELSEWKTFEPFECSACGQPFPPGTNGNRRYHKECVELVSIRCNPNTARHHVWMRDEGVCADCGRDTGAIEAAQNHIGRQIERTFNRFDAAPSSRALAGRIRAGLRKSSTWRRVFARRWTTPHLWEMEHVTPIIEGGGLCGLDGLATLCVPCHKKSTRDLAKRLADARRGQQQLTLTAT